MFDSPRDRSRCCNQIRSRRLEMELLWARLWGRKSGVMSRGLVQALFLALAIFRLSLPQPSVIFSFSNNWVESVPDDPNAIVTRLTTDDITCLGDFRIDPVENSFFLLGKQNSTLKDSLVGRCLYRYPIQLQQCDCASTKSVTSFSTKFHVAIYPLSAGRSDNNSFQGMAFIITGDNSTQGASGGYLGWLNASTNAKSGHDFAVEVDVVQDLQFEDPVGLHVGVDANSLTSLQTAPLQVLDYSGVAWLNCKIWIDYQGPSRLLEIFVSCDFEPTKPPLPIISTEINLASLLSSESMFVGFSASGNISPTSLVITDWSFNSNGFAPDAPDAPFISGPSLIGLSGVFVLLVIIIADIRQVRRRLNAHLTALAKQYEITEEDLKGGGPEIFKYKLLSKATKGFSPQQLLGSGGFGSVYRGQVLLKGTKTPTEVAVKRISSTSHQGSREFLAEIKIIGRVQHRNLVRLLGWCHQGGELLLVYDYMPHGSLDQHLFKATEEEPSLTWARRLKIVSGVAKALAYLHEEWENRVIHRDVKSSNVMLDQDFNGRLGDFGLARLSEHDQAPPTTENLAGTWGYLAPELYHTRKATEKTDVYSFGAMTLEVATGKNAILSDEDKKTVTDKDSHLLVDWVWGLYTNDAVLDAADRRLHNEYNPGEMTTLLKIGLLCSHPDPDERPTMREVLNIWKGSSSFPNLPRMKPRPVFVADGFHVTVTTSTDGHSDSFAPDRSLERNPVLRFRRHNATASLPL